jgi:hypothetical protein
MRSVQIIATVALFLLLPYASGQPADTNLQLAKALETIQQLADRVAAQELRIRQLETEIPQGSAQRSAAAAAFTPPAPPAEPAVRPAEPPPDATLASEVHDHMVQLPGGSPTVKIRGFFDFNFGLGTDSNPLIFPIQPSGRSTFQSGEFDLFLSSKLSRNLSFLGEIVIGSDTTNAWGLDIERVELTYRPSRYFEIAGGRYHTSIGYYNTAFHHGNWFSTAAGRPFMYYFEDSGGLLPVHQVGFSATGLVPGHAAENLGLHWIAEVGNGRSSDPLSGPVQNFQSDKTSKALNFAGYVKPHWLPGLQAGGSFYEDRLYPGGLRVNQHISSAYLVYNNSVWEFLAEGVLLANRVDRTRQEFNSRLSYVQLARKFGVYRPYVRYQYVRSPEGDPVNVYTGRYQGPSVGLRIDFTPYAALKLQYNRLNQGAAQPANGLLSQLAFTF